MDDSKKLSRDLRDIKQMMERSSRFISLSGLSGISAGICALIGVFFAHDTIEKNRSAVADLRRSFSGADTIMHGDFFNSTLIRIAALTFLAALLSAFLFTYRRSKRTNIPIWGYTAKRLLINVSIPIVAGGIFLLALINNKVFDFVAPGCLIFYGLGVLNASNYTLSETRYLACGEILLGVINLFFPGQGLYFWAAGFGVLHILYGIFMWWKYERN
ncbi:MAG TPA: hypothetical protein VFW07_28085 [Parafilimonas sp.]|nr:hypothetical protein [Parafilimonas sp.]